MPIKPFDANKLIPIQTAFIKSILQITKSRPTNLLITEPLAARRHVSRKHPPPHFLSPPPRIPTPRIETRRFLGRLHRRWAPSTGEPQVPGINSTWPIVFSFGSASSLLFMLVSSWNGFRGRPAEIRSNYCSAVSKRGRETGGRRGAVLALATKARPSGN